MSEAEILSFLDRADARGATAALLRLYGGEVYGYVCALAKNRDQADEAFAQASEQVLSSIAGFRRESSLRTWFYTVARHATLRELSGASRRRADRLSLIQDELAEALRTATLAWQETRVKDKISELRESLSKEERELIALRVDRQLSWEAIAAICSDEGVDREKSDLKKAAARCRKQFERAKDKLRELARGAGLI